MYLYGCSMGGNVVTHYHLNDSKNIPYSALATYGCPIGFPEAAEITINSGFGLYDVALGFFMTKHFRTLLPDLEKHTSKETIEKYRDALYNKSWRVSSIDEHVIAPMFGFKDVKSYYDAIRIKGKLHMNTTTPIMHL